MMMKTIKKIYPDWVEKEHVKGTSIKQIGDNYYLYECTSKKVKGKSYPVSIQRYIGKITKEGLIKPETISFIPEKDVLVQLRDEFDLSDIDGIDRELLEHVCLLKVSSIYYIGKLDSKTVKAVNKYFNIEEGVLCGRI